MPLRQTRDSDDSDKPRRGRHCVIGPGRSGHAGGESDGHAGGESDMAARRSGLGGYRDRPAPDPLGAAATRRDTGPGRGDRTVPP